MLVGGEPSRAGQSWRALAGRCNLIAVPLQADDDRDVRMVAWRLAGCIHYQT